jgi:hypothetical protein
MTTHKTSRTKLDSMTEEIRQLVRNELVDVSKSPHFVASKRYPSFLHYVVEKALEGKSDELKERTIGVEVFGRKGNYDTNNDPSVRVVAGEVRKRLALYYSESTVEHTVQISLPAGSYIPEFFKMTSSEVAASTTPEELASHSVIQTAEPDFTPSPLRGRFMFRWKPVAVLALLILVAAWYAVLRRVGHPNSVDRFWQPIRVSSAPVLVCSGAVFLSDGEHSNITEADQQVDYPYVSIMDANVLVSLADLFAKNHTEYAVQPISSTTLANFRERPVVLIGAYDNKWTLLLLKDQRFRFAPKPAREIDDGMNPSVFWARYNSQPYKNQDDYAVVARFHDKLTNSLVVVIAGIGKNGTEAAAQFVTSSRYLDMLDGRAKDWSSKNLEIVLKTTVVDGKTGAPSIVAIQIW